MSGIAFIAGLITLPLALIGFVTTSFARQRSTGMKVRAIVFLCVSVFILVVALADYLAYGSR